MSLSHQTSNARDVVATVCCATDRVGQMQFLHFIFSVQRLSYEK